MMTTSVFWKATGTTTSISTGKRKLSMQSVSQYVNNDIEYKQRCKTVRSQQVFLRWHLKIVQILVFLSHTSHFIDNEEFLVLPDFSHGKILTFRTKIIQLSTWKRWPSPSLCQSLDHSNTRRCSWHFRDHTVWTRIYLLRLRRFFVWS